MRITIVCDYAAQSRVTDPGRFADRLTEIPGDLPQLRAAARQAWRSCRDGTADVERFCVDPGLEIPATRGWFQVRHNLIQDLASLAMNEMLLWDECGLRLVEGEPSPEQLALLDALAV
jgi:hypothetical protein